LRQEVAEFQNRFPQYQINLQHYDSAESIMTPLVAGQVEVDVILASQVLLNNLWTAEQIAPMSDFFPPSFVDSFAANSLSGATRDDLLWGLPDTTGFHLLLFYNKELVDTPPATTEEMVKLARTLTDGSHWGLGVNSYDPLWLLPWLSPNGGWLVNEAGQPTLNTPAMEAALKLYLGWQDRAKGVAPVETYDKARDRFLAGNMGMMIDGEWAIAELDRANRLDWGVALLPTVNVEDSPQPAAPLTLGRYWAISRSVTGDRALAAAAFLEAMTQPERQLAWATTFNLLPTRREALDSPTIVNDPVWRVNAAQMRAGRTVPLGSNINLLLDAMREPLRAAIDGELSPAEAAEHMQANTKD
jgi:ABC-type glycerol-3-phosphate transport system substrate-binding protein